MTEFNEPGDGTTSDNLNTSQNEQDNKSSQSAWGDFSDDDTKYVGDKGWKAPKDILKSYRELEKQASTKISIPKDEDKEAWDKLYAKLGRPESADKYALNVNDKDKAEIQKLMFETNQTSKQATALVKGYEKLVQERMKAEDARIDEENKKQEEELFAEWGDKADQNKELAARGAKLLGLNEEELAAVKMVLAPRKYLEAMKTLGQAISEDNFPTGQANNSEAMSTEDYYKSLFKE